MFLSPMEEMAYVCFISVQSRDHFSLYVLDTLLYYGKPPVVLPVNAIHSKSSIY